MLCAGVTHAVRARLLTRTHDGSLPLHLALRYRREGAAVLLLVGKSRTLGGPYFKQCFESEVLLLPT